MEEHRYIKQIKKFLNSDYLRQDKRLTTYLVCVLIATFFWFLNALGKEYSTTLNYPIRYINLPENKILTSELPSHLQIRVKAYGFTLFRNKFKFAYNPIKFNSHDYQNNVMKRSNSHVFRIATDKLYNQISKQISSEVEILNIEPDSLNFRFDRIISGKFPVKPTVKMEFEKQFFLCGDPTCEPDSVFVNGPESILDTLSFVPTVFQEYTNLRASIQRNIALEELSGLKYSPKRTVLKIPVDQSTEGQVSVPLTILNQPDSLILKPFPGNVKVSYLVGVNSYKYISSNSFLFTIDFNETQKGTDRLKVDVKQAPKELISFKFYPDDVEYLIEEAQ